MRRDVWRVASIRGVTPSIIAGVAVLTSIDLLIAYLPAYGEFRGIEPGTIGLILGTQAAGAVLSRLFMVRLIDRLGRRRTLALSMLAPTFGLLLVPLTGHVPLLFALVLVAGLGLGLGQPLSLSLVVAEVEEHLRGTAIGLRLTSNRLGQMVLPAVVGGIAGSAGVGGIFTASGTLLGISSLLMLRVRTASELAGREHGSREAA
jgi:MFS family permease